MGVDLHQKVGGTKLENYWFKKPSFLKKLQKRQKCKFWVFIVFICPAIYSTNQI